MVRGRGRLTGHHLFTVFHLETKLNIQSLRFDVWYIYLHLVYFLGNAAKTYHAWMLLAYGNGFLYFQLAFYQNTTPGTGLHIITRHPLEHVCEIKINAVSLIPAHPSCSEL